MKHLFDIRVLAGVIGAAGLFFASQWIFGGAHPASNAVAVAPVSVSPTPVAPQPAKATVAEPKPAISPALAAQVQPFVALLWPDAEKQKISRPVFDKAFAGLELDPEVLDKLTNQPELLQSPWDYIGIRVSATRIANGRAQLAEHAKLLADVEAKYGVDRHILLAIWGMESNYGGFQGNYRIVRALTTLAIADQRRPQFWRAELIKALTILERGDTTPEGLTGSWAGAMGHMQFMPSSFLAYAVDHDGDGRRNIWSSVPDALASAGNYMKLHGKWRTGLAWGFEVVLPEAFDYGASGPPVTRTLAEWQVLGVTLPVGAKPVEATNILTLLLPAGARGPAFLITPNFKAILSYNNSMSYALAVAHLADRIAGGPAIAGFWPTDDAPLDKASREELQKRLTGLGFDTGGTDGLFGAQTRAAIRAYQKANALPEDGYAGSHLLRRLKQATVP